MKHRDKINYESKYFKIHSDTSQKNSKHSKSRSRKREQDLSPDLMNENDGTGRDSLANRMSRGGYASKNMK